MITPKRQLGNKGEEVACEHLTSKGYSIIENNYNTKFGEIDIIAKYKEIIHFIEVKSGNNKENTISPVENLTRDKIRKFIKTVQIYLNHKNVSQEQRWQIDAIVVVFNSFDAPLDISHIENINIF